MYNQWLLFFNSSLNEIEIKNNNEKQTVEKEWLEDGGMKISGKKPKDWSVELKAIQYTDIYTIQYGIKQQKLEAQALFKKAFRYNDEKLFKEAENIILSLDKKQKEIDDIIKNNKNLETKIKEKIFIVRRKIFISKKFNIELSKELDNLKEEEIQINKIIKENINKYILKNQNIITNGPVPNPPIVKSLDITIRNKRNFEKDIDDKKIFTIEGGSIRVVRL